jgi:hypothetical protein
LPTFLLTQLAVPIFAKLLILLKIELLLYPFYYQFIGYKYTKKSNIIGNILLYLPYSAGARLTVTR